MRVRQKLCQALSNPVSPAGTPKYLANKMKAKGLQRLRWYCQICQKQCRDENGFKCHTQSESHLRQMLVVGESAGKHIADFSSQFQFDFVQLLSRRFGTKRVKANNVYQEFIQDKNHLHMNATRWVTLTEFVKHLGRTGVARVDETEKGWFIAWIDNSPKALAKQVSSAFLNFLSFLRSARVFRAQCPWRFVRHCRRPSASHRYGVLHVRMPLPYLAAVRTRRGVADAWCRRYRAQCRNWRIRASRR